MDSKALHSDPSQASPLVKEQDTSTDIQNIASPDSDLESDTASILTPPSTTAFDQADDTERADVGFQTDPPACQVPFLPIAMASAHVPTVSTTAKAAAPAPASASAPAPAAPALTSPPSPSSSPKAHSRTASAYQKQVNAANHKLCSAEGILPIVTYMLMLHMLAAAIMGLGFGTSGLVSGTTKGALVVYGAGNVTVLLLAIGAAIGHDVQEEEERQRAGVDSGSGSADEGSTAEAVACALFVGTLITTIVMLLFVFFACIASDAHAGLAAAEGSDVMHATRATAGNPFAPVVGRQ